MEAGWFELSNRNFLGRGSLPPKCFKNLVASRSILLSYNYNYDIIITVISTMITKDINRVIP